MHLHTMFGDRAGLVVNLMEDMDWYTEITSRSTSHLPSDAEIVIRTGVTYGEACDKMTEWGEQTPEEQADWAAAADAERWFTCGGALEK